MKATLYCGDAIQMLRTLPEKSVQCCVTSPPYWGLRDYGVLGQLGLESTPEEYVGKMVDVFSEVRRVLRDDGTLWLNLGDSYAGGGGFAPDAPCNKRRREEVSGMDGNFRFSSRVQDRQPTGKPPGISTPGLKPKDLVGIPWRVAFALQADGWYLRSDIIWSKPNPMPESVTDRPTKAHEYVFLFSKSQRYFYDADAIAENPVTAIDGRGSTQERKAMGHPTRYGNTTNRSARSVDGQWSMPSISAPERGRNARTVWEITTKPYPNAHFATFPPDLAARCIKAGTSQKGCCAECGTPWERIVEKSRTFESGSGRSGNQIEGKQSAVHGGGETLDIRRGPVVATETTGWGPTCECKAGDPVPCTVLDPFGGSGTTAATATGLGRHAIHIDLNPDYIQLAEDRIGPMFCEVSSEAL